MIQLILKDRPEQCKGVVPMKWFESFLNRYSKIFTPIHEYLPTPTANDMDTNIRQWLSKIQSYYIRNNHEKVLNDPKRIYHCDDLILSMNPKDVPAKKTLKYTPTSLKYDELSTLVMANAAGELAPPSIIYRYKKLPPTVVARRVPAGWGMGRSDSGFLNRESFLDYIINTFYPWLLKKQVTFPVIVYMGGDSSHVLSIPLSEFCKEKQIILMALCRNTDCILKPLERTLFQPIKIAWKNAVDKWKAELEGLLMKKEDFAPLLETVIRNTIDETALQDGFRKCGLYPFSPNAIIPTSSPTRSSSSNKNISYLDLSDE